MRSKIEKELEYQTLVETAKSCMDEYDGIYEKFLNNKEKNVFIKAASANAMFQIEKDNSDFKKNGLLKKSFLLGAIGILPKLTNYVCNLVDLQPIFNAEPANQYLGTLAIGGLVAVSGFMAYECAKTVRALNGLDITNQELRDCGDKVFSRLELAKAFDDNASNNIDNSSNNLEVELEPLEKVSIASKDLREEIKSINMPLDVAEKYCINKFSCDLDGNVVDTPQENVGTLDDNEFYNF